MKKTVLFLFALLWAVTVKAQDKVEGTLGADLVSGYVWRGRKLDNAAVQPALTVSYKGFDLTAWGSFGLYDNTATVLTYSTHGFNVGIYDYWSRVDDDTKYFEFRSDLTAHVFEANIGYDFGPLSLQWYTNFAGYDGKTANGRRAYTSYVEVSAPFSLGGLDWTAAIGVVPYSAANGYYEAGSHGFALTNLSLTASQSIKVTDSFSLPLFAQIIANPSTQKAFLVFGLSITLQQ